MSMTKAQFHDDIVGHCERCGANGRDARQVARERLARRLSKPKYVAGILAGEWDDTPAFKREFGEAWLES